MAKQEKGHGDVTSDNHVSVKVEGHGEAHHGNDKGHDGGHGHGHGHGVNWKGWVSLLFAVALVVVEGAYTLPKYKKVYKKCYGHADDHLALPSGLMSAKLALLCIDILLTMFAMYRHHAKPSLALRVELYATLCGAVGSLFGAILMFISVNNVMPMDGKKTGRHDFVPGVILTIVVLMIELIFYVLAQKDVKKAFQEHKLLCQCIFRVHFVPFIVGACLTCVVVSAGLMSRIKDGDLKNAVECPYYWAKYAKATSYYPSPGAKKFM